MFQPGTDLRARQTSNTIFSDFHDANRMLPSFGLNSSLIRPVQDVVNGLEFCPYYIPKDVAVGTADYCGVWSKNYGGGAVTFLANSFVDK